MKNEKFKKHLATWLAVFFLGVLAGSGMTLLKTGKELDRLYSENNRLMGQVTDKDEQIKVLKERLATKNENVIENISLDITLPEGTWANHLTIKEILEQDIKKILNPVRGQPIPEIKPGFIQALLHLRILDTSEGQFQLKVQWIIIANNLEIQVTATPIQN